MKDRQDLDHSYIGTAFDRQIRINSWNQKKVQQQNVLILGVGGLGSITVINLLRMGIKKLYIIDRDVVDIHNLNRQLLYTSEDVGKRKVDCAIKNSQFHNVNKTEIVGFHGDALVNWSQVVKMATDSNVVFNCIDHGQYFDIAVASLCYKLKIPLIMGGTYATSFTIDFFNGDGKPCYLCSDDASKDNQIIKKVSPQQILTLIDITFLPKNNNPISQSSILVCTICGELMSCQYLNHLFLSQQQPYKSSRLIGYHNTFQIFKFDIQINKKCIFCGDPNYVEPIIPQNQQNKKVEENQEIKVQPKLIQEEKNEQIENIENKTN